MVRIRRHAAADKARLAKNELPVVFIPEANRFTQIVNHASAGLLLATPERLAGRNRFPRESAYLSRLLTIQNIAERGEPRLKLLLDQFGICRGQFILGREIPMGPGSRLVG